MQDTGKRSLAVIGGGIIGTAIAVAARRRGLDVCIFEPNGLGRGTSYGNAAMFAVSQSTPLASPSLLRSLPRMMLDPESPLRIRPSSLPRLIPWGLEFLRHCNREDVERCAGILSQLLRRALPAWRKLADGSPAARRIIQRGVLYVYADAGNFASAEAEAGIRRAHGARIAKLTDHEIHDLEPHLESRFAGGLFHEDVAHVTDPYAFTGELAATFFENGGRLIEERVSEVVPIDGDRLWVLSAAGRREFSHAVISAGIDSDALISRFKPRRRLAAERGYHAELEGFDSLLSRPVGFGDAKFVASPLAGRLRLAGTAEFATPSAPPDWRRAAKLLQQARRFLPSLPATTTSVWMGTRPSTPDSLPVIGHAEGAKNILLAYGHGHLGLTLAAVTAEIICDALASGENPAPALDMHSLDPIATAS